MLLAKIPVGAGLFVLGMAIGHWAPAPMQLDVATTEASAAETDPSSPPACNAPEFIKMLQELADKERSEDLAAHAISADAVMKIESTATIGSMGNFTSCSLVYDHGNPKFKGIYNYLIGRNDAGGVIWRSSDFPPFKFLPESMTPGEHQYP